MKIKYVLVLVIFTFSFSCFAGKNTKKVQCIMPPKCGTHLLLKALAGMGLPYLYNENFPFERWYKRDKPRNTLPPPNHYKGFWHPYVDGPMPHDTWKMRNKREFYLWTHFAYTPHYDKFLDTYKTTKFLMLRDPRAMLTSFVNMVKEGFEPGQEIAHELLLLDLIDGRKKNYIPWAVSRHSSYPTMWEIGICEFYKSYLPFIGSKNCLCVKFEDLVGAKGGGSDVLQANAIKQIAEHVNVTLGDKKMLELIGALFGGSTTFKQGQIDGWKKYFTPTVKQAFKKVPGANQLLIDLGYEKDSNW